MERQVNQQTVQIHINPDIMLQGTLNLPDDSQGMVIFAHGSGSSRHSPRNRFVASILNNAGLTTLLIDLLTADEEEIDMRTRHIRFDIGLLATRLEGTIDWSTQQVNTRPLNIGLFGASTGAAAALVAAANRPSLVSAVVSRGGRPDLAGAALSEVQAPTLLIVGGEDTQVIELNQDALMQLQAKKHLEIVPGASHLFEEPGTLETVASFAQNWFTRHLAQASV